MRIHRSNIASLFLILLFSLIFSVSQAQNVGINMPTPLYDLDVGGDLRADKIRIGEFNSYPSAELFMTNLGPRFELRSNSDNSPYGQSAIISFNNKNELFGSIGINEVNVGKTLSINSLENLTMKGKAVNSNYAVNLRLGYGNGTESGIKIYKSTQSFGSNRGLLDVNGIIYGDTIKSTTAQFPSILDHDDDTGILMTEGSKDVFAVNIDDVESFRMQKNTDNETEVSFNNAGLVITRNSVTGKPQLDLKEDNGGFARLQFSNTSGKRITVAADPSATTDDSKLNFFIEDAGDIMTVRGNQRVGINDSSPSQTLDINAASGDSPLRIRTGNTDHMVVSSLGELEVNATAPSDYIMNITNNAPSSKFNDGLAIQINTLASAENDNHYISFKDGSGSDIAAIRGNGSGSVELFQISDRRHKQNINKYKGGLALISNLDAYTYEMKVAPGKRQIGFIAQELYKSLPQIVSGTPETTTFEDPMMVDYAGITPVLVAAIKELDAKNKALTQEVELLKKMNDELLQLRNQMHTMQAQLDGNNKNLD